MSKMPYQCECTHCQAEEASQISQEHRMINQLMRTLNEKQRRQFVGLLAKQYGYGGIEQQLLEVKMSLKTKKKTMDESERKAVVAILLKKRTQAAISSKRNYGG
ncbi:hypothetical protein KFU94_69105 [Chloroflexi bacterium TSY]|nr:hypothetical protein [Chloroflexi bacterium TSY]